MDLGSWLRSLGLAQYEAAFRENAINEAILPKLTAEDLKEIGVTAVGHRRVLLDAIAELRAETPPKQKNAPSAAAEPANKPNRVGGGLPEAERRQLTVMFCDLVGSTTLSGRLDPEDMRAIIGAYHRCGTELIERNGGFVAKYMGDGVLAYFGYPQAHEYDAERAVRAGLALVEAVPKLEGAVAGTILQVRVGIATGLVVVGDLLGAGAAQEQAVVGETPNLAARLQTLAEPGAVVIASSTRRLIGGLFEYRDLGTVGLKGFAGNMPAFQVLGAGTTESRFEALRATTTPLVGRDEEIDLLTRRWEQVKRGDGCVVLISGEAGIGKSRIAQTVAERISAGPHTRLRYFCSPYHQDSALYPSIAQLERAAGFRREDTPEQQLTKLEAVLSQQTNDLGEALPLLADLLSIPTGDRYPSLNLSPQKRKDKTLLAQLVQVEGLAARDPVLMVWEDVQWSDPSTRDFLDLLIERIPTLRVLVIITFRPEFAPPWIGRPHVTLLSLNRLAPRQRVEMITRMLGGKAMSKDIVDQIVDRTDGVPLFIEELTKSVVETGALTETGGYTAAGQLAPLAIPMTLQASLLARLDRLAPTRELAQIGAALGRQFSHELISAVAQMPQHRVDDTLAQLVHAELIFRRGTPPNAEYTFKHALVQDAAYDTLLRSRRRQLHAQIIATLEARFPEIVKTQPGALARHCVEAGLVEKAVGYWLKAGQQAIARGTMTEAVLQLRKGLVLVSEADAAKSQELELNLQIELGAALIAINGYSAPEPGEAFARARQLCDQLNRPLQMGRVLRGQFVYRLLRGELKRAERHAEEMRHLGEALDDTRWKCIGSAISGRTCTFLGEFIDARAYHENALSLWDPTYRVFAATPEDEYVLILISLSRTLLYLGHVNQARVRRNEALAEARRLSPYTLAFALCVVWYSIDWAIDGVQSVQTMRRSAEEVLAISTEQGFSLLFGIGNVMRGWCLSAVGQSAEGIPLILRGQDITRATGTNLLMPFNLIILGEVYEMASQPEAGLNRLAEAAQLIETTQERWVEAEVHRWRGRLLLSANDKVAAEENYYRAIAVARRQSAKFWELRAAVELARLWRDQGKGEQAHDLLAPVYGWFTEGFDTLDLKQAKVLLDELAS